MKKTIALIIAAVMCVCLFSACGGSRGSSYSDILGKAKDAVTGAIDEAMKDENLKDDIKDAAGDLKDSISDAFKGADKDTKEVTDDLQKAIEDAVNKTQEELDAIGDKVGSNIPTVSARGTVAGQTYTNAAAGISFTLGSDWVYYTDEEIASVYGSTADELYGDLENTDVIYDMYAENTATGATLNINLENTSLTAGKAVTEDEYITAGMRGLEDAFAGTGMEMSVCEKTTVTTGGTVTPGIYIELDYYGTVIYEIQAIHGAGDYMCAITAAGLSSDEVADILSGITIAG